MKFGTDGIRGRAGQSPVDEAGAVRFGRMAARRAMVAGEGRVLVARDTRPSGQALAHALCRGALAEGAQVWDAGIAPSPAVALAMAAGVADAGVMITASHNPASDNGFKLFLPGGLKPDEAQTPQLEAWLAQASPVAVGEHESSKHDLHPLWFSSLQKIEPQLVGLRGRKLVIDLAHGALSVWAESVLDWLRGLGLEVSRVDAGEGLINDAVGSEHPERLAATVRTQGAFAGLAVDGDADRALLVDERGEVLEGDALAVLLARGLGLDRLAVTVMSSMVLEKALPGVSIVRTPVGDRHLAQARIAQGIELAVESSGHALLPGEPSSDGLHVGLVALGFAAGFAQRLSEAARLPFFARELHKVPISRRQPLEDVAEVEALMARSRRDLPEGRLFLRYSGTEPVLRVLVEGPDAGAVREMAQAACRVVHEVLG